VTAREPAGTAISLVAARQEIEAIDREIVALIDRRWRLGQALADAKRRAGQPLLDPAQEARVVRRAAELARSHTLPEEDVRDIFWRLIALTRRGQEEQE
jgi:chorismate mutase